MVDANQELIRITWWLVAATFSAAIVALIIAVWGNWLRLLVFHPKLEIACNLEPPNCEKTKLTQVEKRNNNLVVVEADCYYFRILVKNNGCAKAESVEIFATELYKKRADDAFHKIDSFIPMNLTWTHSKKEKYYPTISKKMFRHCDLGYVIKPSERGKFKNEDNPKFNKNKTVFGFELEVKPNSLQHLIEPGIYRLKILIASSNTKPKPRTIELNLTGDWDDDEEKMFSKGIGIKTI